ncbi:MAG TPA: TIGR00730 family Rossman fold protein [Bacteroidales bacterium]|nr:TIGR00730 family Rossman fold protein [Bacteroidales bacterium]
MRVCVFASSSSLVNSEYGQSASVLGGLLAKENIEVVYGGGGIGLMGKLADSVIENGGTITGVIPSFMKDEGWDHPKVKKMIITSDMGERKKTMFSLADGIIALPGGVGTLEELTEAMTLKQLGLFKGPIVILNTGAFYNSLIDFLGQMITGHFLRFEHKGMWEVAGTPEDVLHYLRQEDEWLTDPRSIARI